MAAGGMADLGQGRFLSLVIEPPGFRSGSGIWENGDLEPKPSMLPPDTTGISLSPDEVARYSRHLILPEVGMEGQKRLKAAAVLCVGTGGLGSPLLLYLAAAGVGRLGVVDFDVVDYSNLQRQVIHVTSWVGKA